MHTTNQTVRYGSKFSGLKATISNGFSNGLKGLNGFRNVFTTGKLVLLGVMAAWLLVGCSEPTQLRWATFNIRYDNPKDGVNNWENRRARVYRYIQNLQLDVVGMQEVLHHQFEDLCTALPDYQGVGVGREDGARKGEYSPLFFRKDRFELLDSNTFWLSQWPDSVGSKGWDAACTRIATWAKLRDKANGQVFMAVNTHFDHVGETARKESALLIMRKIEEIVGKCPAVLTGDFNVTDESEAYRTLTTNDFQLKDAHRVAEKTSGVGYTFHNFARMAPEKREKIDFIFVTPQIRVKCSEIPVERVDSLLSDHNPEWVDLVF